MAGVVPIWMDGLRGQILDKKIALKGKSHNSIQKNRFTIEDLVGGAPEDSAAAAATQRQN